VQRRRGRAPRERFQFIEDQDRDVAPSALRRRIGKVGNRHEAGRLVKRRVAPVKNPSDMLQRTSRPPGAHQVTARANAIMQMRSFKP
jgi:hypothetical protein